MDNAGPDRAIFWISAAVVIFHGQKVVRCVQFTGQEAISQKATYTCNKTLRLALKYVKNWFKSLQSLTVYA